jgi:hypothetical protein
MKCNETVGKWCKNKHGASKIIDTSKTYQDPPVRRRPLSSSSPCMLDRVSPARPPRRTTFRDHLITVDLHVDVPIFFESLEVFPVRFMPETNRNHRSIPAIVGEELTTTTSSFSVKPPGAPERNPNAQPLPLCPVVPLYVSCSSAVPLRKTSLEFSRRRRLKSCRRPWNILGEAPELE